MAMRADRLSFRSDAFTMCAIACEVWAKRRHQIISLARGKKDRSPFSPSEVPSMAPLSKHAMRERPLRRAPHPAACTPLRRAQTDRWHSLRRAQFLLRPIAFLVRAPHEESATCWRQGPCEARSRQSAVPPRRTEARYRPAPAYKTLSWASWPYWTADSGIVIDPTSPDSSSLTASRRASAFSGIGICFRNVRCPFCKSFAYCASGNSSIFRSETI